MNDTDKSGGRLVSASMSLTIDGHYSGPGGPEDLGAIVPYMTTDVARDQLSRIHAGATTALLGRRNAEGFLGWWSQVAEDESADPRDRGYARWLLDSEKVVLSRTLTEAPWERATILDAPAAAVVADLKRKEGGDILVNNSASVIKALLAADLLDRLFLIFCPEIVGGGERLFDDGLPASRWALTHCESGAAGEVAVIYERTR